MTSVDSNFNFLCGRPHGAGPPPSLHMRPPEPDPLPPPCGRHKWMAPSFPPSPSFFGSRGDLGSSHPSAVKQRRALSVIGPSTCNQLPLTLRLLPQNNVSSFCTLSKTFLFGRSWT